MKYTLQKSVLIFLLALGVTRTNAQDKWSLVSCPDTAWFSMDLFGVNDTIICSIERGTLYTSTDGARSWAKTSNVQSANRYSQQNVYYGGNLYCCNYADRTIHRYNGTNWVIDTLGIQGTRPTKIWAFDNKMFAYTSVGANRYFYYRNNPTGAWIPTTGIPMNSNSVYFLVAKGPNGYYAHSAATGLFFSTDGISFTSVPATNLP